MALRPSVRRWHNYRYGGSCSLYTHLDPAMSDPQLLLTSRTESHHATAMTAVLAVCNDVRTVQQCPNVLPWPPKPNVLQCPNVLPWLPWGSWRLCCLAWRAISRLQRHTRIACACELPSRRPPQVWAPHQVEPPRASVRLWHNYRFGGSCSLYARLDPAMSDAEQSAAAPQVLNREPQRGPVRKHSPQSTRPMPQLPLLCGVIDTHPMSP